LFYDLVLHFKVITAEIETYSYAQAPVRSRNGNSCTSSRIPQGGQEVWTSAHTGLAERSHLVSSDFGFHTHILHDSSIRLWKSQWSNASWPLGFVIGGVAEKVPERIIRLVYLHAYLPQESKSAV